MEDKKFLCVLKDKLENLDKKMKELELNIQLVKLMLEEIKK